MVEMEILNSIVIASLTVAAWSILYRENSIYRIVEHITLGVLFGYRFSISVQTLWDKTLYPMVNEGSIPLLLVTLISLLIFLRLIPKQVPNILWVSRIPLALLSGIAMAIGIRGALYAQILKQTVVGSWFAGGWTGFNNIVISVFAITTMVYFIYSRQHRGIQGVLSRVGRIGLMFLFGTSLGTQLMGNTGFSVGQMPIMVTGYGKYVTALAIILIIIDVFYQRSKQSTVIPEQLEL